MIRRNLVESVTLFSCSGAIICVLLNYVTNISPVTGVWFTVYVIVLFIVSVLFSFRIIQWFLHLNKPLKFDLDDLASYYRGLSRFRPPPLERENALTHVYDTNELSVISTVLERKLVSSWYVHYVSQEISFPFACKQLLDQMIGKAFQICNQIEPKDVFIDTCTILTSHLKEFKKALKRQEKSPTTTVESHYKKTHLIFNNTDIQSADHCTNILRIVLKELVPWEFWDTPHSELLVRILSKKLDNFVDTTLADPAWINDKLLTLLKKEESHTAKAEQNTKVEKEIVKEKLSVEINQEAEMPKEIDLPKPETTTIESALSTLITKSTAPILQRDITEDISSSQSENNVNEIEEVVGKASEPVDIKTSPILRQRRGRQGRNEVKIYDRIIEVFQLRKGTFVGIFHIEITVLLLNGYYSMFMVPWEFWDTPHSELLVRILSKKLDNFVDTTLADPAWINDKLLTLLKKEESHTAKAEQNTKVEKEIVKEKLSVEINQEAEMPKEIDLPKPETTTIESALSTLITKSTAPILQRDITEDISSSQSENNVNEIEEVVGKASEPVDIKTSPILRQRRGRQGRNEVKIYDRIIEGSVKTWENDIDLQCISLGQDLLASLNGEITLSRLWGQDGEPDSGKSDQALWFGEDDALDMELETPKDSSQPSPVKKENHTTSPTKKEHQHSPNPTDALLKDLQTTVHQAKSKIGDLQVEIVDVPRANDDEAAGMMEGLLDFGIAGLRKGLRFTGLSDEAQDKSPSHHQRDKEKMENTSPPPDVKGRPIEKLPTDSVPPTEVITSTVIQKEENGLNSGPHLVKQQRVASQDSLPLVAKPLVLGEFPTSLPPLCDSPEPEYEEAADLSTSIAKLRCLLQQRELSPNRSEEGIWWEGAEETRGRTHHHYSSRPVDTATLADEYDTNADRNSSPGQTSNNMQRLDRLLQRTVTGVFNSIKTAVGAEEQPGAPPLRDWTYVCTSVEMSVCGAVARLVGSRRAVSRVDAALDSLDHLPPAHTQAKELVPEDFEEWCAMRGACWCACAELAAAAGLLHSHVAYRMGTLLFAELAESLITAWLAELTDWLKKIIFRIFEEMADEQTNTAVSKQELREFNVEHTCDIIVGRLEALQFFGEETVSDSVKLCVSSISYKEMNKDVIFRVLDLFALHFKNSASVRNPSFDSN